MSTEEFILTYRKEDICKASLLCQQHPEVDRVFAMQQIEGWQKAQVKLSELSQIDGWIWPVRLSMEQCSSELTAKYKKAIIDEFFPTPPTRVIDLTGGFGIDAYYMQTTDYVEQNEELCRIVTHNSQLAGRAMRIHHTQAESFLQDLIYQPGSIIYLDPARRDRNGGKVFRIEDCTPNLVELYEAMMQKCDLLMIKLSPMLDITEALRALPSAIRTYVVAVKNEVKEVLILCAKKDAEHRVFCVNLESSDAVFSFTSEAQSAPMAESILRYLYEPNNAIMKAGAYREIGNKFGILKLAENSHLYTSDQIIPEFPGRIWEVHEASKEELKSLDKANIITRNYPLKPEDLRKKYKLKDGGDSYLIGTRLRDKAMLIRGNRIR